MTFQLLLIFYQRDRDSESMEGVSKSKLDELSCDFVAIVAILEDPFSDRTIGHVKEGQTLRGQIGLPRA